MNDATQGVAAHTPGPWVAIDMSDDYDSKHAIVMGESRQTYPGYYTTAEVVEYDHGCDPDGDGWAEAVANARLIAAAPDLLAACKAVAAFLGPSPSTQLHAPRTPAERAAVAALTDIHARISAAIAKAEGTSTQEGAADE